MFDCADRSAAISVFPDIDPDGTHKVRIRTLEKRSEFQRVRGGGRCSLSAFVLEGKPRTAPSAGETPRFGFTVTKKVGNAVVRNRIKRRLRAALAEVIPQSADWRFDYVVVARLAALDRPFMELRSDLETAFRRVHAGPSKRQPLETTARDRLK